MAHSALQLGDSIDIIAPGFRTNRDDVDKACDWLRSLGYEPRVPKDLYGPHFLHSAPDETRLAHLKNALQSSSKVIWCLRGGYGSNRLLPELAKMKKPKHSKLLIGLSDITSIQMFLCMHWGWPSLHTSLLDRFAQKRVTAKIEKEILDLITGNTKEVTFQKLRPMNKAARVRKNIHASLWGGNMVTLQSLIGTEFAPNTKKPFILFLEEIGERGYRVDRILEHFDQAGWYKNCRAVIFGDMMPAYENDGKNLVIPAMKRFAENIKIPVLDRLPSGHSDVQRPVPIGTKAHLSLSSNCVLKIESGIK